MQCLVTGASGFIGAWLARELARDGHAVVAQMRGKPSRHFTRLGLLNHDNVRVVANSDIAEVVRHENPEELFHLAGMSQIVEAMQEPERVFQANAQQTWHLLETLKAMPTAPRCVVASTDSIYGEAKGQASVEDDPVNAFGPYEVSKAMADMVARSYAQISDMPVTVARLGNTYGAGDENSARLVPSIIDAIQKGEAPHLRGGGKAVRSLLHVRDCVSALRILAANAGKDGVRGEAFNVSGTPAMTILEITTIALAAFGKADLKPTISKAAPGETSVKYSRSDKLKKALGWSPKVQLRDGLEEMATELGMV